MLISGNFKTLAEIDKAYSDHIESVAMSGIEFDREGLEHDWNQARLDFMVEHPTSAR